MGTDLGGSRIRGRLALFSEGSGDPSKGLVGWICGVMPGAGCVGEVRWWLRAGLRGLEARGLLRERSS